MTAAFLLIGTTGKDIICFRVYSSEVDALKAKALCIKEVEGVLMSAPVKYKILEANRNRLESFCKEVLNISEVGVV